MASIGAASADDFSSADASGRLNWSGIYVGANAGYAWGDNSVDLTGSSGAIFYKDPFLPGDRHQDFDDSDGFVGGLQAGVNQQYGKVVVGLEADVAWSGIDAELTTGISVQGAQWDITSELETLATFRARLGYLVQNNLLVYATAGAAWGEFDVKQATTFKIPPPDIAGGRTGGTEDHYGWTIGGGAELALTRNWTIRGEYLYVDLGKQDYDLKGTTKPGGSDPYTETFAAEYQLHILRAGLNYSF